MQIKDLKELRISGVPQTVAMLKRIDENPSEYSENLYRRYDSIQKYIPQRDLEFLNEIDRYLLEDSALPVTEEQIEEFQRSLENSPEETLQRTLESYLYDCLYTGNYYVCNPTPESDDSVTVELNNDNFGIEAKLLELRRTHPSDYFRLTQILGYATQKALLNNEFETADFRSNEKLSDLRKTSFCVPKTSEFNTEAVQKHNAKEFVRYLATQTAYDVPFSTVLQSSLRTKEQHQLWDAPRFRPRYEGPDRGLDLITESRAYQLYFKRGVCANQANALVVGLSSLGVEAKGFGIFYEDEPVSHGVAKFKIGNKTYIGDPTYIQQMLLRRIAQGDDELEKFLKSFPEDLQKKYKTLEDFLLVEEQDYLRILKKTSNKDLYLQEIDYSEVIQSDQRYDRIARSKKNELASKAIYHKDSSQCKTPVQFSEYRLSPLPTIPAAVEMHCLKVARDDIHEQIEQNKLKQQFQKSASKAKSLR